MQAKVFKTCMICGVILFPIYILYMLTTAHLMMVTEYTLLSYIVSALLWGTVEAIPFLKLIHKSAYGRNQKIGLSWAAVLISVLILFFSTAFL